MNFFKAMLSVTAAVVGAAAVVGCENTAPSHGRMTTDPDKGLIVKSDSPSVPQSMGIRAGATVPPANAQPEVSANSRTAPLPPGLRTGPTDRPYTGNPTTKPAAGVSANPVNPPRSATDPNVPGNTTGQPPTDANNTTNTTRQP